MPTVTDRPRRRLGLDLTPLRTSRDYRLVFAGGAVSGFGSFITYVTIPFQVAAITHDPLMVGLLGVCELVPILVMGFVGGALADFLDRRLLVRGGEFALAALCAVLLINALSDRPHLWLLYAVAALTAAVDGVQRPALEAMVPRLVTPEEIPATSALQSLGMQVAQLAGPALAGILIATIDLAWVYAFDLATFAVSVTCLTLVNAVPPPPAADRPSIQSVITGLKYARSSPELLGTYLVDINAMFFGMPQALYPFLATGLGGPKALGLLRPRSARCWPRSAQAGPGTYTGTASW
jgi:MFS family permease